MACGKVTGEKVTVEEGGGDNRTGDENSRCERRKDEGMKGSESRCVEMEANNRDGDRKKRRREKEQQRRRQEEKSTTWDMQKGGATLRRIYLSTYRDERCS